MAVRVFRVPLHFPCCGPISAPDRICFCRRTTFFPFRIKYAFSQANRLNSFWVKRPAWAWEKWARRSSASRAPVRDQGRSSLLFFVLVPKPCFTYEAELHDFSTQAKLGHQR
ncbi:MAG: hypothetical protein D3908_09725 [Candidatus Electrothrix sp. AUS4]|nr:hypothetical protein [Candidatus Electrothrix sp. AUS4]